MRHSRFERTRCLRLRCPISTLKKEAACTCSRRYPPGWLHGVARATPTIAIQTAVEILRSYLAEHLCQCRYAHCVLSPSDSLHAVRISSALLRF